MPASSQGEIWWFKNLQVTETAGARDAPGSRPLSPQAPRPRGPSAFLVSPHTGFLGSRGSGGSGAEIRVTVVLPLRKPGPNAPRHGPPPSRSRSFSPSIQKGLAGHWGAVGATEHRRALLWGWGGARQARALLGDWLAGGTQALLARARPEDPS